MAQLTRLTKAQLIERINELEREVNALYVEQRPSRTAMGHVAAGIEERRFMLNGVPHVKTRAVGTKVWTIHREQ